MSDANDLTIEIAEVTEFRQNVRNFQNQGKGISEIEGKVARAAMSEGGEPSEFQTRMSKMTRMRLCVPSFVETSNRYIVSCSRDR